MSETISSGTKNKEKSIVDSSTEIVILHGLNPFNLTDQEYE